MSWLRVDDGAPMHPKVLHVRSLRDPAATGSAVVGFVMLIAAWSGRHDTDCEIPLIAGEVVDPLNWETLSAVAVKVGMLSKPKRLSDGQRGWVVCIDDGLFHLMSREEKQKNRHRRVSRQDQTRVDLHLRDSDVCRYCGQTVNPADGLGGRGREFDHPDPAVADVVVVSCRRCNGFKHGRTVEEAEMDLRPAPAPEDRYFHPKTLAWLANRGIDPQRPAAPVADPASAARGSRTAPAAATERAPASPVTAAPERPAGRPVAATSTPGPATSEVPPEGVADHRHPGRDGTGRVGSLPALPDQSVPRARDGPRRRGSRGRRGRGTRDAPAPPGVPPPPPFS